jgi:hypothetical protein
VTFVFRTSSFFVVFVITLKATTFVVGNTANSNSAADRLNDHVERLVDEAVRSRGETREAADKVEDMAFALRIMGERLIERALESVVTVAGRVRRGLSRFARSLYTNTCAAASVLHKRIHGAMPKKEVKHDGYTAAGQCG